MSTVSLHDIAPRLARARDHLVAQLRRERDERRWHRERELHLEWLVAHRDLQLVRAGNTRNGRYIRQRQQKLEQAERLLAEHRRAA
jgi:hypothetical protein